MSQPVELINAKKLCHWSFEDHYQSVYEVEIDFKNHVHHGRKINKYVTTPRLAFMELGEPETIWVSPLFPKKEYKTLNGLLKKLGLPKYEPKKEDKK
jgi:hypothetical protein